MSFSLAWLSSINLLWTNPWVAMGTVLFFGTLVFVLYAIKFNKDPYFPFKKHTKVRVIELVMSGNAMVFADEYKGKLGDHGIYLSKPNIVIPQRVPIVKGSKEDLLILTVSPDGVRFPAMVANIQVDEEADKWLEKLADAKERGRFYEEALEMETKVPGMTQRILAFLTPAIEVYQALSDMVAKEFYQLEFDAVTTPLNEDSEKKNGLVAALKDKNVQLLAIVVVVFGGIYLMASGSLASVAQLITHHDSNLIQMQQNFLMHQRAIMQWCAERLAESGKFKGQTVEQIYNTVAKQTGVEQNTTKIPTPPGSTVKKPPLINQIPQHI